jgi:hypothetical protein
MSMNGRVLVQALGASALTLSTAALTGCTAVSVSSASGGNSATATHSSAAAATPQGEGPTVAAAGSTTPMEKSSSGPGSSSGSNACGGAQLTVKLTDEDAGLGHRSVVLLFTNDGSASCTLTGYPGAAVTDSGGKVVVNALRSLSGYEGGATSVTTVTLAPGGEASAVLEWLAAPAGGQSPTAANCPGMDGGRLLITPPNTTAAASFSVPQDLCQGFAVHPVVSGASGRSA